MINGRAMLIKSKNIKLIIFIESIHMLTQLLFVLIVLTKSNEAGTQNRIKVKLSKSEIIT